jgi:hypothetical protein
VIDATVVSELDDDTVICALDDGTVICALDDGMVICALDDARFLFFFLLLDVDFVGMLGTVEDSAVCGGYNIEVIDPIACDGD